jgi:hypothetical protein
MSSVSLTHGFPQQADRLDVFLHSLISVAGTVGQEPFLMAESLLLDLDRARLHLIRLERVPQITGGRLHHRTRGPAEQPVHRRFEVSAAQVPQRVVDGADGHQEVPAPRVPVRAV